MNFTLKHCSKNRIKSIRMESKWYGKYKKFTSLIELIILINRYSG
jgi:hypothetical protein